MKSSVDIQEGLVSEFLNLSVQLFPLAKVGYSPVPESTLLIT